MKKTVKDIEKLADGSFKWAKTILYYFYLPAVIVIGAKTINWSAAFGPAQPM